MSETTTTVSSSAAAYLLGDATAADWGIADVAGEHARDFDLAAAELEFAARVEAVLHEQRPDWQIVGTQIIAPVPVVELSPLEREVIVEGIREIDAGEVLAAHVVA